MEMEDFDLRFIETQFYKTKRYFDDKLKYEKPT